MLARNCLLKGLTLSILTVFAAFISSACFRSPPDMLECDIFAMDTFMSIRAYTDDEELPALIEGEIRRLEELFSATLPNSDVSRLNSDGSASVNNDTAAILGDALLLCERTGGALDISVYPLVCLWGFTSGEYKVPSQDEIDDRLQYVGHGKIKLDGALASVAFGMQVDLGAVAKGYTSDRICSVLREQGIESAVINLGGNVQTLGRHPDGRCWQVGVKDPFDTQKTLLTIGIEDRAVITSGNYERCFTGDDGRVYCHIIDPKTGRPTDNGIVSVTVIGENGLICDGLSTALFVMGEEKAVELWRDSDDFEMIYVTSDGRIGITEGIADSCTNLSRLETAVIARE